MDTIWKRILFYLGLAVVWWGVYSLGVDYFGFWKPYAFPSPVDVLKTLIQLSMDYSLGIAILFSLKRVVIGYFISVVLGLAIGLAIVRVKYIDENLGPLILGLQALPNICWLPFAILWYGLNESAIIFVIAVGSTFAITIAVESGMKNINPLYINSARTLGGKGFKLYLNVMIPCALPNIVSGMKQGWSFAWRALMAGEMFYASVGLGHLLMMGRDLSDISQVTAVMIVIIILGLTVDKLVFSRIESVVRYRWGLHKG